MPRRTSPYEHAGVRSDNAVFRKGLVLGLTLAELGILVIFILLLALGGIMASKDREIAQLRAQLPPESAAKRVLSVLAERTGQTPEQTRTMARELVAAAARDDENAKLRHDREEVAGRLARLEDTLSQAVGDTGSKQEQPAARSARLASAVDRLVQERAAARAALADARTNNRDHLVDAISATRLENERLKGTVAYANRRLAALGKGTERPACWATPQGAPEYIFDVTLFSSGILVHDRKLPNRAEQEARLPISGIGFDRVQSGPAFQAQTRPLFDWGEAHDCRFFVTIADRTAASDKARYKNLKLFVEGHFYKYEGR